MKVVSKAYNSLKCGLSKTRRFLPAKVFCEKPDVLLHSSKQNLTRLHKTLVKLTSQDVRKIRELSSEDAAKYSFKLICASMGIPKDIAPKFVIQNLKKDSLKLSGSYSWVNNVLAFYKDSRPNKEFGKCWIFGVIRHEMEHYRQAVDVFRSPELSKTHFEYIENLAKKANVSEDEIEKYQRWHSNFRERILKVHPPIKIDSSEYSKAEKYLKNIMNYKSLTRKNLKEWMSYLFQPLEFEACKKQGINWVNYLIKGAREQ